MLSRWYGHLISPSITVNIREDIAPKNQLLTLLLFKEYRKEDYRTIIWNFEKMDRIRAILGLITIPHFTAL
jgi:hypothetical protein